MARSKAATEWLPDTRGQALIDQITSYIVAATRSTQHLRSLDFTNMKQLWAQVEADFLANPRYPSVFAPQDDIEGREQFQSKCHMICFPPTSEQPLSPEEYVLNSVNSTSPFLT